MEVPEKMTDKSLPNKMRVDSQSFPEAIYEGLEEGLIVGNSLQYVSVCCDVADCPLAQPRAA